MLVASIRGSSLRFAAADLNRPALVVGDFSWKPQKDALSKHVGAMLLPVIGTAIASNASPTRAVACGGVSNTCVSAGALPGILHHNTICYGCDLRAGRRCRPCVTGAVPCVACLQIKILTAETSRTP